MDDKQIEQVLKLLTKIANALEGIEAALAEMNKKDEG